MKVFQSGISKLYIANSMLREERRVFRDWSLDILIPYLIDTAWRRVGVENINEFLDFCKRTTQKNNDFNVGIISAHGTYSFGRWCYSDGLIPKTVQKWVDKNDGVYDLILLHICNPQGAKPLIKKSMAVVPVDHVSFMPGGLEPILLTSSGSLSIPKNLLNK